MLVLMCYLSDLGNAALSGTLVPQLGLLRNLQYLYVMLVASKSFSAFLVSRIGSLMLGMHFLCCSLNFYGVEIIFILVLFSGGGYGKGK